MNGNPNNPLNESLLRGIEKQAVVYPADRIPDLGFGVEIRTIMDQRTGAVLTGEQMRFFEAGPCQCLLSAPHEFGGVCHDCEKELEQLNRELEECDRLSQERRAWLSRPCNKHFTFCSYPGCPMRLCTVRHAVKAPDGRWYCCTHYKALTEHSRNENAKRTLGGMYLGYKFWKELNF